MLKTTCPRCDYHNSDAPLFCTNCRADLDIPEEIAITPPREVPQTMSPPHMKTGPSSLDCWFCGGATSHESNWFSAIVAEVVSRGQTGTGEYVKYRKNEIAVPRCSACLHRHRISYRINWIFASLGLITGIWYFAAYTKQGFGSFLLILPIWLGIAIVGKVIVAQYLRVSGTKPIIHADKFPDVKRLVDRGWQFGEPQLTLMGILIGHRP